jgi:hypothetical protein
MAYRMIEEETTEIEGRTERGTERRLLTAKKDEDELMRRYRRIQSLFRQLQVSMHGYRRSHSGLID